MLHKVTALLFLGVPESLVDIGDLSQRLGCNVPKDFLGHYWTLKLIKIKY